MVETVQISSDPSPEAAAAQAKHDQAMADKVDQSAKKAEEEGTPSPVASSSDRPEWLPEKFKSGEDLAKAYNELEQKQGKESTESKTDDKPNDANITPETPQDEVSKTLESKGLDFNKYSSEVISNGELSEASYKELEAEGIPKEMVDQYISGQQALAQSTITDAQSVVGGAEEYSKMIDWAAKNISKEEQVAFDKAVSTTDIDQAKLAISGLHAKYKASVGDTPNLLEGETSGDSSDGYESRYQMTKDMKDPRYKKDPAFRKKVEEKVKRSNFE